MTRTFLFYLSLFSALAATAQNKIELIGSNTQEINSVVTNDEIAKITWGYQNFFVLTKDGTLKTYNMQGTYTDAGLPSQGQKVVDVSRSDTSVLVLFDNDSVAQWRSNFGSTYISVPVPPLSNVVSVHDGPSFKAVVHRDGTISSWGHIEGITDSLRLDSLTDVKTMSTSPIFNTYAVVHNSGHVYSPTFSPDSGMLFSEVSVGAQSITGLTTNNEAVSIGLQANPIYVPNASLISSGGGWFESLDMIYSEGNLIVVDWNDSTSHSRFKDVSVIGAGYVNHLVVYPETATAISKPQSRLQAEVFPTITNGIINIWADLEGEKTITLTNLNGYIAQTWITSEFESTIDISDLSKGSYLLKIQNGNSVATEKIYKY